MATLADLYDRYVVQLDPLLFEMGRIHGVHVDNEARLQLVSEMTTRIRGIVQEAQQYVPDSLYPTKHYKTRPDTTRPTREMEVPSDKVKTCSKCGTQHVTQASHTARKGGKGDIPLNECYHAPIELRSGTNIEYDVVLPFNPGSDEQLRTYAEMFRIPQARNWRTGEKSLDARQLQKLINKIGPKHPIFQSALDVRKVRKARGYAKAWIPDERGCIYGQFKNVPETLRLSQSNHNLMNVSHRGDVPYAEELRSLIIAPPGYVLMAADSASIEAVFTGKEIGSEEYIEIAKKGIHAWWACRKLGLEPTPANIKRVKNAKDFPEFWSAQGKTVAAVQILYETKKRTVHGVSYGMEAKLLHGSYPDSFRTMAEAQAEIDEFYSIVPGLKDWHFATQKEAHRLGYLESRWGFRNYYYRVFVYDWAKKNYKTNASGLATGEDAKAAIAFRPQTANAMFQRENLVMLGKTDIRPYMNAIGHCHDENGATIPEDKIDQYAQVFAEIMNRPIKQYDNVQIGVVVKVGKRWSDMKPVLTV